MRKNSCWKRIPCFLTKCSYPAQNDDWRKGCHNERNGKKIKAETLEDIVSKEIKFYTESFLEKEQTRKIDYKVMESICESLLDRKKRLEEDLSRKLKNTEQEIAIITDKIKENTSSGHNLNVDKLREAVTKGELVLDWINEVIDRIYVYMIKTRWRLFGNLRKGMEKMDKKDEIMLVNQESLAEKIYIIRGQKVMLDFELAEIYGYETKRFNEQVKNNIEKFDDDFRFQLTKEEWENLRSKISTSKSESGSGGRRYLPFAFTEAGIYTLMTVLKGELAVKQSKALIRTFKQMKDYIVENQGLIGKREFLQLSMQITSNVVEMQDLRWDLMISIQIV